jgi:DHA3 family macrolide efflux protein-like MFS transporter
MPIGMHFSILKNHDFLKIVTSQVASIIAQCVINYVLLLRMYQLTNSTLAVSVLWIAYSSPTLIVGPFAATIVDLFSRKKLLMLTNILQALTLVFLIFVSSNSFLIYCVIFVYSFLNQFYLPAESSVIPNIVPQERWAEANGFFFLSKEGSILSGFGLAVVLTKFFSTTQSILVCSGLLVVAFIAVSFLPDIRTGTKFSFNASLSEFLHEVLEGYRFIKEKKVVMYPLLLITCMEILLTIIIVNLPSISKNLFRIDVHDASMLVILPAAFGAFIAVYFIPKMVSKLVRKRFLIEASLMLLAFCLFAIIAFVPAIPENLRYFLIPVPSFFLGLSFITIYTTAQTFMQEVVPDQMLGRIIGNMWFIVTLATIPPLALSASVSEITGVGTMLFALSLAILSGAVFSRVYGEKLKISF